MDKYDYMKIYTTALKECIINETTDVIYEEDSGRLLVLKNGNVIHWAKAFDKDIDYDTEAKLLMDYIKSSMSEGKQLL